MPGSIRERAFFFFSLFFSFFLTAAYCDAIFGDWVMGGPKGKSIWKYLESQRMEKGGREGRKKKKKKEENEKFPLSVLSGE